jgi:hypothetical protein
MKTLYTICILLCTGLLSGQTFNLDNKFLVSIPPRIDWTVLDIDSVNNFYHHIKICKDFKTSERKFSDIIFTYDSTNKDLVFEHNLNGCFGGYYYLPDTFKICGYQTYRWFGVNCNWLIDDSIQNTIAGYSIDWIIEIEENKYLSITASYFSNDKNELSLIENELVSIINELKIKNRGPNNKYGL